jgi:hypothetical protein
MATRCLASRSTGRAHRWPEAGCLSADTWIGGPTVDEFVLHGNAWEILACDVPILVWPTVDGMAAAVRVSLAALIEAGCAVAWVGAEGLPFCDPPQLFDPGCMSTGVLALMTAQGHFECALDPEQTVTLTPQPRVRSIQIGLSGDAVRRYVDDWIVGLEDVTAEIQRVRDLAKVSVEAAEAALPVERPYPISDEVAAHIGATPGAHSPRWLG